MSFFKIEGGIVISQNLKRSCCNLTKYIYSTNLNIFLIFFLFYKYDWIWTYDVRSMIIALSH